MSLDDLELRNVQELLDDIADGVELRDGDVLLALVERPSTAQRLIAVRRLPVPADQTTWTRELSDLLYDEVHALPIPPRDPKIRAALVTVIVRRGIIGWGPAERTWALAWRYSNHNSDAFDFDIVVVTEHGWASLWSHAAGRLPAVA